MIRNQVPLEAQTDRYSNSRPLRTGHHKAPQILCIKVQPRPYLEVTHGLGFICAGAGDAARQQGARVRSRDERHVIEPGALAEDGVGLRALGRLALGTQLGALEGDGWERGPEDVWCWVVSVINSVARRASWFAQTLIIRPKV